MWVNSSSNNTYLSPIEGGFAASCDWRFHRKNPTKLKSTTFTFSLLLLLFSSKTVAQSTLLDSLQTERLAKLCQLWGHVHFFHPWLAYKDLPWDSTFAEAVPHIVAAKDSAAVCLALAKL